ncbi:MAG: ATP-binding protein [Spirochaetales bacterium]|nr:ATP-binding protein [Spirochaetales bacterium]
MKHKEIVLISGKGGTGKTSMTASLIPYFPKLVIADCDVDAPDLDILLEPKILQKEDFIATAKAVIDSSKCINCGNCINVCRFNALSPGDNTPVVKEVYCEGCNACSLVCSSDAISIAPYKTGEIFDSVTEFGPMIHARLTPGEEVSGRLVSEVRKRGKKKAEETNAEVMLIDGPPGIACNVISSITGANLAIIVTEPTTSGLHDLIRVHDTAKKLKVPTAVIINKDGLSSEYSNKIVSYTETQGIILLGRIPLSNKILDSINNKKIPSINAKDFFISNGWELIINNINKMIYSS